MNNNTTCIFICIYRIYDILDVFEDIQFRGLCQVVHVVSPVMVESVNPE